jgi:hypothetical protein
MIPRDVPTRWNSTFDLLLFAKQYRKAIDHVVEEHEELEELKLTRKDWKIVDELLEILEVRYSFFLYLSDFLTTIASDF